MFSFVILRPSFVHGQLKIDPLAHAWRVTAVFLATFSRVRDSFHAMKFDVLLYINVNNLIFVGSNI